MSDARAERPLGPATAAVRRALQVLVVAIFAAIALLTLLSVYTRYVLNASLPWTDGLLGYLLAWLTFAGAPLVQLEREHLTMEVLPVRRSGRVAAALRAAQSLGVLAFMTVLAVQSYAIVTQLSGQSDANFGISISFIYSPMLLSAILTGVVAAGQLRSGVGSATPLPDTAV